MHWAKDDSHVAIVDAKRIRVRSVQDGVWTEDVRAGKGVQFLDVSLANRLVLQWRKDRYELVPIGGGRPRFEKELAGALDLRLSEDGTRAVVGGIDEAYAAYDLVSLTSFIDLGTGLSRTMRVPLMSAKGLESQPVWVRRRGAQIHGSYLFPAGVFDYVADCGMDGDCNKTPHIRFDDDFFLAKENDSCQVEGPPGPSAALVEEGTSHSVHCIHLRSNPRMRSGSFFGWDADDDFKVLVAATVPREEAPPRPKVPTIEVHRPIAKEDNPKVFDHFELSRSWPFKGKFNALWVSPEGSRVIVSTTHEGVVSKTVYDTKTGAVRGTIPLAGECFEFSSDGTRIAERTGSTMRLSVLP